MIPDGPMFTEADRLTLFTRAELAERLGDRCSVDWFLRFFNVPVRCKGRVIVGADIVRALTNPPASEAEESEPEHATIADIHRTPVRTTKSGGTCAAIEPIGKRTRNGN
jgi:hypothetical protein